MKQKLEQMKVACRAAGIVTAPHVELAVDTFELRLNRVDGHDQLLRDLDIAQPCRQQPEDALLLLA